MAAEFLAAAGRRWYVLVLGVLITLGLAVGATVMSSPTYSARGLVLLLPPEDAVGDGGNPFLALGALDMPARIIVSYLDSPSARADVETVMPTASYEVAMEEATRGPVIAIEVTDTTPEGALATLQDIADAVPSTLARLQQELEVPAESTVTSMPLTMSTEAEELSGNGTLIAIVAAGAGLAATAAATVLIDRMVLRRSARRRAAPRARAEARRTALGPVPDSGGPAGDGSGDDGDDDGRPVEPAERPAPRTAPGSRRRAK
ncbi:hypothetical protein E1212_06905 [Jiangella ureilytica]|uniref:Polysaccharide chain length determinant N-terminal domain-containing protein n=1 Tax=Jiangella ureilytica TaxID=2530374 RepID=A0A4R4RSW8_9ACTN|nr:hypothetical protein [Jiangella ureilytica]TDC53141.1 hypothetical protein E1212_06905 [Jiangella ureilytica]